MMFMYKCIETIKFKQDYHQKSKKINAKNSISKIL